MKLFKKIIITGCLVFSAQLIAAQQTKKPNILLIFADDLGYMDCAFNGSKIFETPNLDALAKQGMLFTNAYAAAGNCAPSRAAMISGKYSPLHGVYAVGSTTRGPVEQMKLVPVKNTNDLNPDFVTVAEALKAQGYATGIFGKWHLGKKENVSPEAQGFDVYFDSRKDNPNKRRNEPEDPKGIFSLTREACKFMELNKDKPFFTYLAHHAIHGSIESRPSSIEKFTKKGMDSKTALYAGSIYDLDASVGLILKFLKGTGLDKNTLVIFTSDNGATQQSSQEPLRGNKGAYYEGGIREPFIAFWPNKIKAGTVTHTPIINLDLYPTFLAAAGKTPDNLDGENLLPIMLGKKSTTERASLFWHFPGYLDKPVIRGRDKTFRTRPVSVIRKGDWKLHLFHEEWLLDGGKAKLEANNAIELYNLKDDVGERKNLSPINTAKRDELLNDLLKWMKEKKAPMPTPITATNKPVSDNSAEE